MSAVVKYADTEVGAELPPASYPVARLDLIKYCGASGDFNVIHWNERIARAVGLPNVIAHGMFTMAQAARYVTDWAGDPGAMTEFGVRFSAPVVVPDDDGFVTIEVSWHHRGEAGRQPGRGGADRPVGRGQGAHPVPRGGPAALTPPMANVREQVRLSRFTTLGLGGPARRFVVAGTDEEIIAAVRDADQRGEPLLVLGGGSNLVVSDDGFPGTVIQVATKGIHRDDRTRERARTRPGRAGPSRVRR